MVRRVVAADMGREPQGRQANHHTHARDRPRTVHDDAERRVSSPHSTRAVPVVYCRLPRRSATAVAHLGVLHSLCGVCRSPIVDAWAYANSEKDRIAGLYQQWAAKQ